MSGESDGPASRRRRRCHDPHLPPRSPLPGSRHGPWSSRRSHAAAPGRCRSPRPRRTPRRPREEARPTRGRTRSGPPKAHLPLEIAEDTQRSAGVRIVRAERRELPVPMEVTGFVTPDTTRVTRLRALAEGVIARVDVKLGDRVRAGQPLIEYDNVALGDHIAEYRAAVAARRQAEADLEVRRAQLRAGRAVDRGRGDRPADVRAAAFRARPGGGGRAERAGRGDPHRGAHPPLRVDGRGPVGGRPARWRRRCAAGGRGAAPRGVPQRAPRPVRRGRDGVRRRGRRPRGPRPGSADDHRHLDGVGARRRLRVGPRPPPARRGGDDPDRGLPGAPVHRAHHLRLRHHRGADARRPRALRRRQSGTTR